jgi:hypothetical protein
VRSVVDDHVEVPALVQDLQFGLYFGGIPDDDRNPRIVEVEAGACRINVAPDDPLGIWEVPAPDLQGTAVLDADLQ